MVEILNSSNLQLSNKIIFLKNAQEQKALTSTSALGGNIWTALRASVVETSKNEESQILVRLLYLARTYFQNRV
jgi:hypothetical protein